MAERKRPGIIVAAAIGSLVLGFCCCGQGSMTAAMPAVMGWQKKMMAAMIEPERAKLAAKRQVIEEQRAATADQQEIAALDQQIAQLDMQTPPDLGAFYDAFTSPSTVRCYVFEGLAALSMNLLIFIAGFGLLAMKPWARKLAIYAAIGRIVTALVYAVLAMTIVAPAMVEGMKKFQETFAKMSGSAGQPAMPDMSAMMAMQGTVGAVLALIMTTAWPIALLVMLNTRKAKEALAPRAAGQEQIA